MTDQPSSPSITLYWRPGCGFCSNLRRGLDGMGIAYDDVNIWEDADGAEFVRQANRGNELVPTVDVGGTVLSNPTADEVAAVAGAGRA